MKGLIIFFAVCALTAAMVPRDRRAVDIEEGDGNSTTDGNIKRICAPDTPCGWTVLKRNRDVEIAITNSYCECGPNKSCVLEENEPNLTVVRCKSMGETPVTPS